MLIAKESIVLLFLSFLTGINKLVDALDNKVDNTPGDMGEPIRSLQDGTVNWTVIYDMPSWFSGIWDEAVDFSNLNIPFYIKFDCSWCTDQSRKPTIYKRLTDVPSYLDMESLFLTVWTQTFNDGAGNSVVKNAMGTDFELFSNIDDARSGSNAWTYCDFNEDAEGGGTIGAGMTKGFPYQCGPSGQVAGQNNIGHGGVFGGYSLSLGQEDPPAVVSFQPPDNEVLEWADIYKVETNGALSVDEWAPNLFYQVSTPFYIKLFCFGCTDVSRNPVIYKRITPVPSDVDLKTFFLSRWSQFDTENNSVNQFNTDFELYSSYENAETGQNKWGYCSFVEDVDVSGMSLMQQGLATQVGFPYECGPSQAVGGSDYIGETGVVQGYTFQAQQSVLNPQFNPQGPEDPVTLSPTASPSFQWATVGSWFMNQTDDVSVSIVEDSGDAILTIPYNISHRDKSFGYFKEDCKEQLNHSIFDSYISDLTGSDGFIQFNNNFILDSAEVIFGPDRDDIYSGDTVTGGNATLCVVQSIYLTSDKDEVIHFLETIIDLNYDLATGNFKVENIDADRLDAEKEDLNIDYGQYLKAYQCDASSPTVEIDSSGKTYEQGSVLTICVRGDDSDIVDVENVENLLLSQGNTAEFNYIEGGSFNAEIVTSDCTHPDKICVVSLQLLGRFFSVENPPDLQVAGDVSLSFPVSATRHLRTSISIKPDASSPDANTVDQRLLNEEETGGFAFKVMLKNTTPESSGSCLKTLSMSCLAATIIAVPMF